MGKPKNKSKGEDLEDLSDTEVAEQQDVEDSKPATKQSKKDKKKKKKNDDWEDDVAHELATLSLETNKGKDTDEENEAPVIVNKKEKKKKKKQKVEDSEDEGDEEIMPSNQKSKKKAAFSMLMMEDEGSDNEQKSQSESEEEVKPVQKQEPVKKKKEKKKTKKQEEEDIDALLAEIDKPKEKSGKKSKKDKKKEAQEEAMETEKATENGTAPEDSHVEKSEPKVVSMEDLEKEEDDDDRKKKRKKKKKEDSENTAETAMVEKTESKVVTMEDLEEDDEDDKKKKRKKKKEKKGEDEEGKEAEGDEAEDGGEGGMKTAAQKRKEKKEREREKKKAEKIKQAKKKENEKSEEKDKSEEKEKTPEEETKAEAAAEDKSGDEEAPEEGKKKKKDKKKKGEKEEKKEEKKKKTKAPISALKELLKKQKEEEERLQREEEERIKKEEEAIAAAIEKKRLEEERKQRKKEKEKEKRERLKAEGKLLTAQQKADKRRAQQMLEAMRAQGLKVPSKDEGEKKKKPVYGPVKKKKKDQTEGDNESREETPTPTVEEEKPAERDQESPEQKEETSEVKEESDDGVKDEWDASSEEEEEEAEESEEKESSPDTEPKVEVVVKSKEEVKKSDEKEEEEEEEESEDEEESDDEEDSDSEEDSETESDSEDEMTPYERAEIRIKKHHEKCESQRTTDVLRAPVVCVLGHVDTGKTKILDKLRRTNVQDGEAGGITQQIGATNVPKHAIQDKTNMCKEFQKKELKLPGLLIIDTPGHESFSNLRSRGSSLCDIAILVIDIMHGLEPQTIESINLLKERKTPFVVALNKIDRLYQWKANPNVDVVNTLKKQTPMCKSEFDERSQAIIVQLAEQSLNAALFYENKNPKEYISLVPTSAHSGDGMGNLLALICDLTQTWLAKKVSFTQELHATVMEVKALPGLGTTVDVILVNGKLSEGDQIVIAGTEGPIVTQIRGLLMPQPMRELRVKSQYEHHKEVMAAQGVKIIGKELEKALAGLPLYVAHNDDEVEYYKEELNEALKDVLGSIKLSERGVFVQASTLGSLEALLEFLRTSKIPYAGINIGPVHRKDIMKASIMLEHDSQWAVILAFDVKVERDAQEMADSLGVRIFTADIIYHLEEKFLKFREDLKRQKQEEFKHIAVFPCKLRVLPQFIFNQRDPIVVGVSVEAGIVKVGSPLCVPSKEFVEIGTISSIENNHKTQETARRGEEVCIKIENTSGDAPKLYGRHFDHTDLLVSKISRTSIDAVKDHFREDMTKQDWALMVELKKMFSIL